MDEALQVFKFQDREVRTVMKEDSPWWVAKDVCDVLELTNPTETLRGLDDDELTSVILRSGGQNREMNVVSEPGLYKLIFRSRKDKAKAFTRWVTHEVLPTIRKTGSWGGPAEKVKFLMTAFEGKVTKRGWDRVLWACAREIGLNVELPKAPKLLGDSNRPLPEQQLNQLRSFLGETFPASLRPVKVSCLELFQKYTEWSRGWPQLIDNMHALGVVMSRMGYRSSVGRVKGRSGRRRSSQRFN